MAILFVCFTIIETRTPLSTRNWYFKKSGNRCYGDRDHTKESFSLRNKHRETFHFRLYMHAYLLEQ